MDINNTISVQSVGPDDSPDSHDTDSPSTSQYPVLSFVRALYNYTAATSSELDLKEGDRIEILERDPSGWWFGRCGMRRGWLPSNFCTGAIIAFVRVLNDRHTNIPRELVLNQGDVIDVHENDLPDYWHGSIGSRSGWFDPSYCDVIEEDDIEDIQTPDGSEVGDELEIEQWEEEAYRAGIWL